MPISKPNLAETRLSVDGRPMVATNRLRWRRVTQELPPESGAKNDAPRRVPGIRLEQFYALVGDSGGEWHEVPIVEEDAP